MFPTTSQCPMHNKPLLRFDSSDYLCLVGVVNSSCKQQAETLLLQFLSFAYVIFTLRQKCYCFKSSDSQLIHSFISCSIRKAQLYNICIYRLGLDLYLFLTTLRHTFVLVLLRVYPRIWWIILMKIDDESMWQRLKRLLLEIQNSISNVWSELLWLMSQVISYVLFSLQSYEEKIIFSECIYFAS